MSDGEDEEIFEVYWIIRAKWESRESSEKKWWYKVRWYGYGPEADSAIPAENMSDDYGRALITRFWVGVGVPGEEKFADIKRTYSASRDWMANEKLRFDQEKEHEAEEERVEAVYSSKGKGKAKAVDEDQLREDEVKKEKKKKRKEEKSKAALLSVKSNKSGSSTPTVPKSDAKPPPQQGALFDDAGFSSPSPPPTRKGNSSSKKRSFAASMGVDDSDDPEDDVPLAVLGREKKKKMKKAALVSETPASSSEQSFQPRYTVSHPFKRIATPPPPASSKSSELSAPRRPSDASASSTLLPPKASASGPKPAIRLKINQQDKDLSSTAAQAIGNNSRRTSLISASTSASDPRPPLSISTAVAGTAPAEAQGATQSPLTTKSSTTWAQHIAASSKTPSTGTPVDKPVDPTARLPKMINKHRGNRLMIVEPHPSLPPEPSKRTWGKRKVATVPEPQAAVETNKKGEGSKSATASTSSAAADGWGSGGGWGSTTEPVDATAAAASSGWGSVQGSSGGWGNQDATSNSWSGAPLVHSPAHQQPPEDMSMAVDTVQDTPAVVSRPSGSVVPETSIVIPRAQEFLDDLFASTPSLGGRADEGALKDTWTGDFRLQLDDDQAMILPVTFSESTIPPTEPGFDVIVNQSTIAFDRTYSAETFASLIQPAFHPPSRFAFVESTQLVKRAPLRRLTAYLRDANRVSVSHLRSPSDRLLQQMLVVFPSARSPFNIGSEIPSKYVGHTDKLVVAMVKQVDSTEFRIDDASAFAAPSMSSIMQEPQAPLSPALAKLPEVPRSPMAVVKRAATPPVPWPTDERKQHRLADRLAIARFNISKDQMGYFHKCYFCMWPHVPDVKRLNADAKALHGVLTRTLEAHYIEPHDTRAKVIFIHAKGMDNLHDLPKLLDRRRTAPQVAFYTYGWDVRFAQSSPHLRSIWTIGGVLSFTPRALLEDPKGVLELVIEAQRDPFWDIYMTPAVIAMVDELEAIQHKKGVVKGTVLHILSDLLKTSFDRVGMTLGLPPMDSDPIAWAFSQLSLYKASPLDFILDCKMKFQIQYAQSIPGPPPPPDGSGWGPVRVGPIPKIPMGNKPTEAQHVAPVSGWSAPMQQENAGKWGQDGGGGWGDTEKVGWGGQAILRNSLDVNEPSPLACLLRHASELQLRNIEGLVVQDLKKDLRDMQSHPALSSYRRFVLYDPLHNKDTISSPIETIATSHGFEFGFPL